MAYICKDTADIKGKVKIHMRAEGKGGWLDEFDLCTLIDQFYAISFFGNSLTQKN